MASEGASTDRLLANILSRVEELSQALSPSEDNGRTSTMSTVNEEVSQVFNRARQPNTSTEHSENQSNRRNGAISSPSTVPSVSSVSAPPGTQRPSRNSTSAGGQRRYFPALNYNKRFLNRSTSSRRQAKKKKCPSGPFIRDLILLAGPDVNIVPRQGARVQLMESGHIICGFELLKEWKDYEVELHIREAFGEKLPNGVDMEILVSVHNTLHTPSLPPNQTLSGFMVHKVFKDKPIYIRPAVQILECLDRKGKKVLVGDTHDELTAIKSDSSDDELAMVSGIQPGHCDIQNPGIQYPVSQTGRIQPVIQVPDIQLADTQLADTQASNSIQLPDTQALDIILQDDQPFEIQPVEIQPFGIQPDIQSTESTIHEVASVVTDATEISIDQANSNNVSVNTATFEEILLEDVQIKNIVVYRATLRENLITEFSDPHILKTTVVVKVINERGEVEKGDGRGVFRDIITEFWNLIFISAAVGASEKVPTIRHDFQSREWEAIARILVYGYISESYIPIQLSPAFLSLCLLGESNITKSFLIESFKAYLSMGEKEIVNDVLSGKLSPMDEDVLELLSSYKCFKTPSELNFESIIWELAHQEIIQKPRYIANCWTPIVSILKAYLPLQSPDNIVSLFSEKRPNGKKVIKMLDAHPSSEAERACFDHLKRYVRSIEGNIGCFLHFITGSNIITCEKITIMFNQLDGKARRPIAHTCTPSLELSSTYQSYNELAEEFSNVLREKGSWEFDIV